ncbi:hypothetical protein [Dickeya sp. CSL RW240]|uniref:hypothetical protein n=1 Tax=Dickeya sp. CSL RW240 TaxID=1224144 RepID=UPI0013146A9D|nr:hypothetical protein [Dickeya sp. CSL RW240]
MSSHPACTAVVPPASVPLLVSPSVSVSVSAPAAFTCPAFASVPPVTVRPFACQRPPAPICVLPVSDSAPSLYRLPDP